MFSSLQTANYFLQKSFDSGEGISPMKLIKLVYIAHGWHLAIFGKPLLTEVPQAWKYGPVIETIYHKFKKYGTGEINQLYTKLKDNSVLIPNIEDQGTKDFLDKIWDVYSRFSAYQLSDLTHQANTPWDIVWNKHGGKHNRGEIIPNDIIEEHYLDKFKLNNEQKEKPETARA